MRAAWRLASGYASAASRDAGGTWSGRGSSTSNCTPAINLASIYHWQMSDISDMVIRMTTTEIKAGDVVKLTNPENEKEAEARYEVAELRGPRVLIKLICDMTIRPSEAVMMSDIEKA